MLETKDFFKAAKDRLALVKEADRDVIMQAAKMMGDCMEDNGVVQLFGLDHGIAFAMELRNSGVKTELLCRTADRSKEDYVSFARSQGAQSVFSISGDELTIYDFTTGKTANTSLSEFRKEF